jgi:hypothetical protein
MYKWILILFAHAGPMSDKDSMALTHVYGFTSEQVCMEAGKKAKGLASGTVKDIRYTCVREN